MPSIRPNTVWPIFERQTKTPIKALLSREHTTIPVKVFSPFLHFDFTLPRRFGLASRRSCFVSRFGSVSPSVGVPHQTPIGTLRQATSSPVAVARRSKITSLVQDLAWRELSRGRSWNTPRSRNSSVALQPPIHRRGLNTQQGVVQYSTGVARGAEHHGLTNRWHEHWPCRPLWMAGLKWRPITDAVYLPG